MKLYVLEAETRVHEVDLVFISKPDIADPLKGKVFEYRIMAKDRRLLYESLSVKDIAVDKWGSLYIYDGQHTKILKKDQDEASPRDLYVD